MMIQGFFSQDPAGGFQTCGMGQQTRALKIPCFFIEIESHAAKPRFVFNGPGQHPCQQTGLISEQKQERGRTNRLRHFRHGSADIFQRPQPIMNDLGIAGANQGPPFFKTWGEPETIFRDIGLCRRRYPYLFLRSGHTAQMAMQLGLGKGFQHSHLLHFTGPVPAEHHRFHLVDLFFRQAVKGQKIGDRLSLKHPVGVIGHQESGISPLIRDFPRQGEIRESIEQNHLGTVGKRQGKIIRPDLPGQGIRVKSGKAKRGIHMGRFTLQRPQKTLQSPARGPKGLCQPRVVHHMDHGMTPEPGPGLLHVRTHGFSAAGQRQHEAPVCRTARRMANDGVNAFGHFSAFQLRGQGIGSLHLPHTEYGPGPGIQGPVPNQHLIKAFLALNTAARYGPDLINRKDAVALPGFFDMILFGVIFEQIDQTGVGKPEKLRKNLPTDPHGGN